MQTRDTSRVTAVAVLVLGMAAVLVGMTARTANAASVPIVSKQLCDITGCSSFVTPGLPVYYKITISVPQTGMTVTVSDQLPAGFVYVGPITCGSATPQNISTSPPISFQLTLAANTTVTCNVPGYFSLALVSVQNTVTVADVSNPSASATANVTAGLNLNTPIPGDVGIDSKSGTPSTVNVASGPQIVTYTIKVKNFGAVDLALGPVFRLEDRLMLISTSVPLRATYMMTPSSCMTGNAASDCLDMTSPVVATPVPHIINAPTPIDFVAFHYPANSQGLLKAGDTMTITYNVKVDKIPNIACVKGGDGIFNQAHISLNLPSGNVNTPPTALTDSDPSNNTSNQIPLTVHTGMTFQDPACGYAFLPPSPVLQVTKVQKIPSPPQPAAGYPWPGSFWYEITVKNIAPFPIANLHFQDVTLEGLGTPPFTTQAQNYLCPPGVCTLSVLNPPGPPLVGYASWHTIFTTRLFQTGQLAPSAQTTFRLRANYSLPDCDSYPGIFPKEVDNVARLTRWTELRSSGPVVVNGVVQDTAQTFMGHSPSCKFQVRKWVISPIHPPKIRFGTAYPTVYRVTYRNLDAVPHTMGTLIDTMRITTNNYATQLPVSYKYQCAPTTGTVTGYPQNNPGWPFPNGTNVVYTTYPQQGVRLIQNAVPVVFSPGAVLTCTVTVVVLPPSPNDPYCATNGALDNSAIIDVSRFYNPNFAWTAQPGFFATVTRPLPKCFDMIPSKTVSPLWTWPGGGPLTFTLAMQNSPTADPIVAGGPVFNDTIVPSLLASGSNAFACSTTGCNSQWIGPPPAGFVHGPTKIRIVSLPAGATSTATYVVGSTAAHPYPGPGGQVCNRVFGTMPAPLGPQPLDFYWKHPDTSNPAETVHAQVCAPVLQTGKILVHKVVTVQPGFTAPSIPFTVTTQCTNGSLAIPSSTLTLTSGQSSLIQGIPVGSTCTTTEAALPPPTPVSGTPCQLAGWSPVAITPNPLTNTTSATMNVTVTNHYGCLQQQTGTVGIKKSVVSDPGWTAPASATFTVTLACQGSSPFPTTSVTVLANSSAQITNVPIGSTCMTSEQTPPAAPGVNANGTPCPSVGWFPPVITPNPLTNTTSGTMTVVVRNEYGCLTPASGSITLKKVVTADPGYTAPASATFPTTVQCQSAPAQTVTLSATNFQAVLTGIPAGVSCVTTEVLPTPIPGAACNSIGWFPPTITPNPLGPTSNGTMLISIVNRYGCLSASGGGLPTGTVTVKKVVLSVAPWSAPATQAFTFGLQCGTNPVVNGSVIGNGVATFANQPANATCTVTEYPPPPPIPTPACAHLGWFPVALSPNPVVVPLNGTVQVTATNRYGCLP